jgi:hypothetical protein
VAPRHAGGARVLMAEKEEPPEAEEPHVASADNDDEPGDRNLFGIDLGRRGDRTEDTSRDEVNLTPVKKVKAAIRTLTERLASAASDRDDAASRAKRDDPESQD